MSGVITFHQRGSFTKTFHFLDNVKDALNLAQFDKYGREGVAALESATPKDTGLTSKSWSYGIEASENSLTIAFYNSNVVNGVKIAVILQYGHATKNGGWVEGRDYINPAIQPVFDRIVSEAWEKVRRL